MENNFNFGTDLGKYFTGLVRYIIPKKKVYTEVMKRASAMQKKVLEEAAEADN